MIIYIKDTAYRQKVKSFIRQNFERYGQVEVVDQWQNQYKQANLILSDDNELLTIDLPQLYFLSDYATSDHRNIYKYQRFDEILNHIASPNNLKANIPFRIIAISSIVGGAGKTLVAETITRIFNRRQKALYLPLLSSNASGTNLSDIAFEISFGAELTELNLIQKNDSLNLNGFKDLADLFSANIELLMKKLTNQLILQGFTTLVIDAGNHYISKNLINACTDMIYISDYQRQAEEKGITESLISQSSAHLIINKHPLATDINHLPLIANFETEIKVFTEKLNNYLKTEGLIGY